MSRSFVAMCMAIFAVSAGGCENGAGETMQTIALVGNVNQLDPHAYVSAVGHLSLSYPDGFSGGCTGTMVAANKVLTAAHCFCPHNGNAPSGGTISFADSTGILTSASWQFASVNIAPGASVCADDWEQLTTNDPMGNSEFDVAMVTLAANTAGPAFPQTTPLPVSLDDPALNYGTNSPGHTLLQPSWLIGYGSNTEEGTFSVPHACVGCNIRRSGPLDTLYVTTSPCSTIPLTSIKNPFPQNCWNGPMWTAPSIYHGNDIEISAGDSGGPLILNADSVAAPAVVAGVASSTYEDDISGSIPALGFIAHSKWAATGRNATFIWTQLGLPFSLSLAQQRAGTAIFGRQYVDIHDRGHVVAGSSGARIVANGVEVVVENDAVVGNVQANAPVFLRDRATTGDITTSSTVTLGNGDKTGALHQGAFQKYEDFSINLPLSVTYNNPVPQLTVSPGTPRNLAPGVWGDLTVYGGGTLTLSDGLYIFHNFDLESNSQVVIGGAHTWIFVAGTSIILRGNVGGPASGILFGAPNATNFQVQNNFAGTIVAPNAAISIDMVNAAVYTGAVFASSVELFEGEYLQFVPFVGNWIPTCGGVGFTSCN